MSGLKKLFVATIITTCVCISMAVAGEVRGVTVPSAVVKVNGKAVKVRDDDTFVCYIWPRPNVNVEVEYDGKKKTVTCRFKVRK